MFFNKKPIDVIIPTQGKDHLVECLASLRHIPFGTRLHVITGGNSWPEAINLGLRQCKNDVIIMDDDVRILTDTFSRLEGSYGIADIFGFKLLFPDGRIQHAGAAVRGDNIGHIGFMEPDDGKFDLTYYCCHVTASLVYIKRKVLDTIGGMTESWTGKQFEDVDFSFRAIQAGFRILYIPDPAIHMESATKDSSKESFQEGLEENKKRLQRKYFKSPFIKKLESYPIA